MSADKAHYEDLAVGTELRFGDEPVTREDVLEFARKYDPQPFHLDDEAAAAGPFGKLAASGWQTAAFSMRMLADHVLSHQAGMGGAGTDNLRWHRPVYPGDRLSCRLVLNGKRRSSSRPEMGLMFLHLETLNQHGEVVMSYDSTGMIRVRHPERD
ncbi:MaoC family dehydratase [Novosphingobium flavum]|uniref:MaoC family dehydratase n=1 Tax=Novosphingobium flavum TaxID=1778672 RepID=A0A7X1FPT8_9SPHN|nr:MaoC family dehydratase [Novosphingobium flavum]MBC2664741.1 MaoC family dehydratase [Novosphingobium flavum]